MSAPVSDIQRGLERLDPTSTHFQQQLLQLLSHQDLRPHIQDLPEPELKGFVELLDKALDHIPETNDLFRKALRRLQSTCSHRGVLPQSHLIPNKAISKKGEAVASGAFANAHEAELDGKKVCVKALRSYVQDTGNVTKKTFYKEVIVWKRLQHPNIVPFLGVPTKIPPFEIICEWMENSTITEYVRRYPEVDRINLMWDVADGLHYLHSRNVIHGDLKGANVLIDKDGHARLTDFGLAAIIRGEFSIFSAQDSGANTTTWAAPEILRGGSATKEGDVFTFSMVAIEAYTGRAPFVINIQAAIFDIMAGKRPGRPAMLRHDKLWEIVERCWDQEPEKRPTTSQLLESFRVSFPNERVAPTIQHLSKTPSTWTLTGAEGQAGTKTPMRLDSLRKDTLDGDDPGPQDPSPVVSQYDRNRLGEEPRPDRPKPSALPSEPAPPVSAPTQRTIRPQNQDGGRPSLLGRAVRKLKKFMRKIFNRKDSSGRGGGGG